MKKRPSSNESEHSAKKIKLEKSSEEVVGIVVSDQTFHYGMLSDFFLFIVLPKELRVLIRVPMK